MAQGLTLENRAPNYPENRVRKQGSVRKSRTKKLWWIKQVKDKSAPGVKKPTVCTISKR